jgi:hypothetical protein
METTLKSKGNKQGKSNVTRQNPTKKGKPTEENIRQKAQEIYNERLVNGEYGNELEDWQKAEKLLSE